MALIKVGTDFYQGKGTPIYLMSGTATRDAEDKPIGDKKHAVVGVAATKKQDGTTVYINLNGWRSRYRDVLAIRKLDSILAVGTLKEREYYGKKYYDLDAEFVCKSGAGLLGGGSTPRPASDPVSVDAGDFDDAPGASDGFAELEEDGELPF